MSINDIKFDHFKNIEELIQHLEMWYAEDDYDAYNRFFGLRDARIMGMIIYQLTNNWNELEEWLKEYMRKNENWYTNELSTYDKQYYGDTYYTTNAVLMTILDKMKEIKEGKK